MVTLLALRQVWLRGFCRWGKARTARRSPAVQAGSRAGQAPAARDHRDRMATLRPRWDGHCWPTASRCCGRSQVDLPFTPRYLAPHQAAAR